MESGFSLALAYALLGTLLLIALTRAALPWSLKTLLVLLTTAFYWVNFSTLQDIRGWPSDASPPERFQLLSTLIEEPDKREGTEGAIYLWGIPDGERTPRAYRLPYSEPLHEDTAEAEAMISDGKRVMGRQRQQPESEDSMSGGDGGGSRFIFEEAPRRSLPPKG